MHILKEKQKLTSLLGTYRKKNLRIGFVPTMGALHQGHISLVEQALKLTDKVVLSIFVNPTQFDNQEDLKQYPRDLEKDLKSLQKFQEDIIVFSPLPSEIYGENIASEKFDFDGLELEMEGKFRKGHFDGVGTVVKKFLEIIEPEKAFFGEKDYQQLLIIKKLAEKLQLKTEIYGCPIDRESSGLARSSRNERLTASERADAAFLYRILQKVKEDFGTKSVLDITQEVRSKFKENGQFQLEYFEIADAESLKPVQEPKKDRKYRAFIAAFLGDIRLIDNIALN